MNQTLPCCGYVNPEAVKWNPYNGVVQCHHCGHTYTPQRQWVGLTNDERCSFVDFYWENDLLSLFELLGIVEAKLKQKNGYAEEKNT